MVITIKKEQKMNNLNEIYVAKKDKEYVLAKIDILCQKYNSRTGVNTFQERALFRSYCHDVIDIFNECFETSLLGMTRCIAKVNNYKSRDNIEISWATFDIVDMLTKLKFIVKTMVAIKDLPSCKRLIGLSAEDIVAKAKNLVKSDIVKASIGVLILGSKFHDMIQIEDVRSYYKDCLIQLSEEIETKHKSVSPIEQYLLDKFNAEIGYCNLAMFKAGIGVAEELRGLVEISKKHIEKYEQGNVIRNDCFVLSKSQI